MPRISNRPGPSIGPGARHVDLKPGSTGARPCNPFSQGLDVKVVHRLLSGIHTAADRKKYYLTPWFRGLKRFAIDYYGSCIMCDRGAIIDARRPGRAKKARESLTVHHRHYRNMFNENIAKDIGVLCQPCHKRYHRK